MMLASALAHALLFKVESRPPWPQAPGLLLFALVSSPIALVVSPSCQSWYSVRL
jgi:hypothetical protein